MLGKNSLFSNENIQRKLEKLEIPYIGHSISKAEILNERTRKTFWIFLESPKHLLNIIDANEQDLAIHNKKIIDRVFKI